MGIRTDSTVLTSLDSPAGDTTISESVLRDISRACTLEWLETNGLGGFASSSVIGLNTRRYHGLLVAATQPPGGRMVLLSKVEETLVIRETAGPERRYDLSTNQYPGAVHPQGYLWLTGFRRDPYPIITYSIESLTIEKHIFLVHGENTVCIAYVIDGLPTGAFVEFLVRPLLACRDFHATMHEQAEWNSNPAMHVAHNARSVVTTAFWYRDFELHAERDRGLDWHEDLYQPDELCFDVAAGQSIRLIYSLEGHEIGEFDQLRDRELARRMAVPGLPSRQSPGAPGDEVPEEVYQKLATDLRMAADQFIVKRGSDHTIIAGYPWFGDWGRDTMIALPGLTLVNGRFDVARGLLRAFVLYLDKGMLPNRFPDSGQQPEYNTVDATLWMFEAVRSLLHYSGDFGFIQKTMFPALCDVVDWHVRGTRYNIHVDEDGLLVAGQPGVQLTWMDAKVGDWVVTPRVGKPVEIQALWFNALCVLRDLALLCGDASRARWCAELASRASAAFNASFWNDTERCLHDVVDGDIVDAAIRPNQVFAVSLRHSMLNDERARCVVDCVERELLTPVGLRSLSPRDSRYVPHYAGDVIRRDGAYHQGTIWSWLMGPFVSAYARVHGSASARARNLLAGFVPHLADAGLGSISEVFDADAPHAPGGCIAQAWSVAEILRCISEDLSVQ